MKDALTYIVSQIVTDEKAVAVEEREENGVVEFIVHVPKEDIGKVIGKDGKVIRAIRNVLKIPAIKEHKKIHITLQEA
jgi:uncharacterized protein